MIKILPSFSRVILLSFVIVQNLSVSAQTWTNPLILENEWPLYGIGDPYILKFNGSFYLYCSTRDSETGIKCWSSRDLINWKYGGLCSTDAITKAAYAPEVIYWNGKFYMYTSPAGNGHYVLSSDSPTGPFKTVTGNLGKSIDGSVFIDDDAKMYFYHAGINSIMGCAMNSPISIGTDINLNVRVGNNWTEGPCVFKRKDIYYMIYTGNHVLSKGYRIDYASNKTGPISSYTPAATQNPILINTEGNFVGLGHGSIFVGPDLDSYFITYHNLAGDFGQGPFRHLNFDRIAWNGDKMLVLGPTQFAQQAPKMPTAYDNFDRQNPGNNWLFTSSGNWSISNTFYLTQENYQTEHTKAILNTVTENDFTAEFNVQRVGTSTSSALYGAVFGYIDEQSFGLIQLNSSTNKLEIVIKNAKLQSTTVSVALPSGFNFSVLHSVRIEKQNTTLIIFLDGLKKAMIETNMAIGKIGYFTHLCSAKFGYIAFSNQVNGSGIFDIYKPVPGTIEAVHYNSGGKGVAFHDNTPGNTGGKYIRNDDVDIKNCSEGGHNISSNETGEWYAYNVNVQTSINYNLGFRYATNMDKTQVRIWQGNTDMTGVIELPNTGGFNNWRTFFIKNLALTSGYQKIRIETVNGEFDFVSMQFVKTDTTETVKSDNFDAYFSTSWNYKDGPWIVENGKARINGYGKRAMGNAIWANYTVETDVFYISGMNAGLIFRVNNPALGGAGNSPELGNNFYQGYFVGLRAGAIFLGKQNYNWKELASSEGSYKLNIWYHLKVIVHDDNIKVYIDDMDVPKIDYTDHNPFLNGKAGLRARNCDVLFDNFRLATFNDSNTVRLKEILQSNNWQTNTISVFPNPVFDKLNISGLNANSQITIYNILGEKVLSFPILSIYDTQIFDVRNLKNGIYFFRVQSEKGEIQTTRFIKN